jgi:hypothetical protein
MVGGEQHFPGFADARRRAKKYFQPATGIRLQVGQQRIRVRAAIAHHSGDAKSFKGNATVAWLRYSAIALGSCN